MKNHVYLYFITGILFCAFGIVSLMVFLTGGKSKYFVKKKLAIGAIIIGITCVTNGCRPVVTCYEVAVQPVLNCVDSVNNEGAIVINKADTVIQFDCEYMYYENVSYRLWLAEDIVAEDSCNIITGNPLNRLVVKLPSGLGTGNFSLRLYYFKPEELSEDSTPFEQFELKITD